MSTEMQKTSSAEESDNVSSRNFSDPNVSSSATFEVAPQSMRPQTLGQTLGHGAAPSTLSAEREERAKCLSVRQLCFAYSAHEDLLHNVSVDVRAGEHLVITGPSGCGKTTLLKCVSGELSPFSGCVECCGKVAVVYQDLRLVTQLSAIQNVVHGAFAWERSSDCRGVLARYFSRFTSHGRHVEQRARELLDSVGLGARAESPVHTLSGGERQRVAIARALMQNPAVILADEPVSGLDRENAILVLDALRELSRRFQVAVVSVLHDRSLAGLYADRILNLSRALPRVASTTTGGEASALGCEKTAGNAFPMTDCCPEGSCSAEARTLCDSVAELRVAEAYVAHSRVAQSQTTEYQSPNSLDVRPSSQSALEDFSRETRRSVRPFLVFGLLAAFVIFLVSQFHSYWQEARTENFLGNLVAFLADLVPRTSAELAEIPWGILWLALLETLNIALLATVLSALFALPLAMLAARNVGFALLGAPIRSFLSALRTVPAIIWALLAVAIVGLGPLAGVIALTAYSTGYIAKFFYEALESIDRKPGDAIRRMGAGPVQTFFAAILPAARPGLLSSLLFMAEYNVRSATIVGIVGAGGIGFYIKEYIDYRFFPAVSASLLMILVVVFALDALSGRVRERVVKEQ